MKPDNPNADTIGRLQVAVAALLFSTGGAVVKACSLTSWQVASFRCGIAACALLIMVPAARRAWSLKTTFVGVAYASTMICYVAANKLTTAANATFLQSTAPLYVLVLSPLLLREPTPKRAMWFMAVLAAAMVLIFAGGQPAATTAPDPARGNLVGALTGVSWGLTIIGLRWLGRQTTSNRDPSAAAVASGNLIAFLLALPFALPVRHVDAIDWLLVAFLGVIQIAVAYVFLTRGVRRIGALEVSLLVLLEPVFSPLWTWLAHGEEPSSWALVGGAVIVAATAAYAWRGSRAKEIHLDD